MKKYEHGELTKATGVVGKRYNVEGEYRYLADGDCRTMYGWINEATVCQYTTCGKCKTKLMSWAKDSECPKCGKIVYLT